MDSGELTNWGLIITMCIAECTAILRVSNVRDSVVETLSINQLNK